MTATLLGYTSTELIIASVAAAIVFALTSIYLKRNTAEMSSGKTDRGPQSDPSFRSFTLELLTPFKGDGTRPPYIALKDKVYDVTAGKDFYGRGGGYHMFAGKNASRALAKMSFDPKDIDNLDLSDLTADQQKTLDEWVEKFNLKYPVVGNFVAARDYTIEELRNYDGKDGKPVFISVKGKIYDVSSGRSFYGPGGSYEMFAGRDASRALAKMSFAEEDLENTSIADLTIFEKDALDDWVAKFEYKYILLGNLKPTAPSSTTPTVKEGTSS